MKIGKATIALILVWALMGLVAVSVYFEIMLGAVISLMAFMFVALAFGIPNVPDE